MAEEKKYTETEHRIKTLEIADIYCQLQKKYDQRSSSIYKSHDLRVFIANAKSAVPKDFRNADFEKYLNGLEEKLRQISSS